MNKAYESKTGFRPHLGISFILRRYSALTLFTSPSASVMRTALIELPRPGFVERKQSVCDRLLAVRRPSLRVREFVCGALIALLSISGSGHAEQQPQTPMATQQSGTAGIASGAATKPVYDEQRRPITAGGFVDKGPVIYADASKASGLSSWRHVMGTPQKKYILETDGSGVGLIDYDNDGWLDIYLVNGSTYDALEGRVAPPHAGLFHNNHDGTFTDIATAAGVTNDRWGFGVAIGDYDNDGWPDIFVA